MTEIEPLQEEMQALRGLLRHPGWEYFTAFVKANVEARQQQILYTPLEGLDGALGQEFMKGEVVGQMSMLAGVASRVEELEAVTAAVMKEREDGAQEES